VKEPVVVAETELRATAMNAAANHQSVGATISHLDRLMRAEGSNFIEPDLHRAVRCDNGTSVPPSIDRTFNSFGVIRKPFSTYAPFDWQWLHEQSTAP
jgi:hypothetical protein